MYCNALLTLYVALVVMPGILMSVSCSRIFLAPHPHPECSSLRFEFHSPHWAVNMLVTSVDTWSGHERSLEDGAGRSCTTIPQDWTCYIGFLDYVSDHLSATASVVSKWQFDERHQGIKTRNKIREVEMVIWDVFQLWAKGQCCSTVLIKCLAPEDLRGIWFMHMNTFLPSLSSCPRAKS